MSAPRLRREIATEHGQGHRYLPLLLQLGRDIDAATSNREIAQAALGAIALGEQYDAAAFVETGADHPCASFGPPGPEGASDWPSLPVTARGHRLGTFSHYCTNGAVITTEYMQSVAYLTGLALDNMNLAKDLASQSKHDDEVAIVAELQQSLLPATQAKSFPVYGLNRPIRQISGDFFDFFERPDGLIPFALGDVSGKGLSAALLMAKTASLFHCLAKTIDDPAILLGIINREICDTASRGMFVTMVAGIYDPASGAVSFANAGHEPPLVRLPDRSYRSFPADAPPLGILADIATQTTHTNLERGELYIFSDGLTEFQYDGNEDLGVEGLKQLVEMNAREPLRQRLETLLADLDGDGWQARDDLTILAIDDALGGASR